MAACRSSHPSGFLEAAISENVLAGTVMIRRAMYMYGVGSLPKDAQGHVDTGLGKGMPGLPSVALVAPTREITATGETRLDVDDVYEWSSNSRLQARRRRPR